LLAAAFLKKQNPHPLIEENPYKALSSKETLVGLRDFVGQAKGMGHINHQARGLSCPYGHSTATKKASPQGTG